MAKVATKTKYSVSLCESFMIVFIRLRAKLIANAKNRFNVSRVGRILLYLRAQVSNMHINTAFEAFKGGSLKLEQDLRARVHTPGG